MRLCTIANTLQSEQNVAELLTDIATAQSDITLRSATALAQVCRSVITGEGPCVAGRMHFSRTLDADDAALCGRILVLAGRHGDPVSRAEADALFEIDAAGGERCDDGLFDDLLAKAVMHHVMSACGRDVPRREIALSPATAAEQWASVVALRQDVRRWLEIRLRELRPSSVAARAIAQIISRTEPPDPTKEVSIAGVFDLAA
jgi:hypothetical protein